VERAEQAGAGPLRLVPHAAERGPEVAVFEAMLDGWRAQQLSRNLAFASIEAGARVIRRFQEHAGGFPWQWTPADLESWLAQLRATGRRAPSTLRGYQQSVRAFCGYLSDPAYGWEQRCLRRFGTHPVQICRETNTVAHVTDYEGRPERRPLTRAECQLLFDTADDRAAEIRARRRKGWLPAFRDATMLKVTYAFGLRRRELLMLEAQDFGANPKAPEFGEFGVCHVRWGKASRGSPPKRRSVLTVMPWSVEVLTEWIDEAWPHLRAGSMRTMWPSERGPRVSEDRFNAAFAQAAAGAGLAPGLSPHCLRHSYVTHLVEDGFDALFVQQQVGHEHASTTSIYTSVSSDYRTRMLRTALDATLARAGDQAGRR
jgi:site-specific recombinase XerD